MTSDFMDLRRFPRVNVEGGYSIQFQAGSRRFFGLPVTTLGGGGCSFRISSLLAGELRPEVILARLCIDHPGIPPIHQKARISWVLGDTHHNEDPSVLVGIEYLDPDLEFIQAIDRCISEMQQTANANPPAGNRRYRE
jgi:hypothetical protein